MELTKEDLETINKIDNLLTSAEFLLYTLSNEKRELINNFHNENYSLNHCLRWGTTATKELLKGVSDED